MCKRVQLTVALLLMAATRSLAGSGISASVTFTPHGSSSTSGTGWSTSMDYGVSGSESKTIVSGGGEINPDDVSTLLTKGNSKQQTYTWDVAATLASAQPGTTSLTLTLRLSRSIEYSYSAAIGWSEPDQEVGGVATTDSAGLSAKTDVTLNKPYPRAICVGVSEDHHRNGWSDSYSIGKTIIQSQVIKVTLTSSDGLHFTGTASVVGYPLSGTSRLAFDPTAAIYTNCQGTFTLTEYVRRAGWTLG